MQEDNKKVLKVDYKLTDICLDMKRQHLSPPSQETLI